MLGGLLLLVAEVATPGGFFVIFFGAGAILVGAAAALGWSGPAWAEWLAFSVLSVALLALFRRPLMRRFNLNTSKPVDRLESESAVVTETVAPGGQGKAELRGTPWAARTSGSARSRRDSAAGSSGSRVSRSGCGPSKNRGARHVAGRVLGLRVRRDRGLLRLAKTAVVVPQQNAYVVERLGKFAGVLDAGFHILVPFIDVIRYRHS